MSKSKLFDFDNIWTSNVYLYAAPQFDYDFNRRVAVGGVIDDVLHELGEITKLTGQKLVNYKFVDDGDVRVYTQDCPGVKKENLTIEVETDKLIVKTKRDDEQEKIQTVLPGKEYDVAVADAKLEDGVLTIRFAKKVLEKKTLTVR